MKKYFFLFSLLLSGLMVAKAQSANNTTPATDVHSAGSSGNSPSGGFGSAGCWEVGGEASFTSQSIPDANGGAGYTSTVLTISPFVGYFPVKGLELGLNPLSFSEYSADALGVPITNYHILFAPAYNFSSKSIVHFFIEGEIGMDYEGDGNPGGSSSGISYGARTGVKIEVAKHAMLNVSLQYLTDTYNLSNSSPPETSMVYNLIIGVGFTVALYK